MKYGLCNLGNSKVIIHIKKIMDSLLINFSTILGHAIISNVMILRNKKFGKYEVCDGLYNSLLCVIKVKENSMSITYPKGCFS